MKNLLIISMVAFTCNHLVACDSEVVAPEQLQDPSSIQDLDAHISSDVSSDADLLENIAQKDAEAAWDVTPGGLDSQAEDPKETNQLPSDPTEDPDQESSFYEFPAWHIPPPSK